MSKNYNYIVKKLLKKIIVIRVMEYIFYEIKCNDDNITDKYIGLTTNFEMKKKRHKYSCEILKTRKYNNKLYYFIRTNGGWENWNMQITETRIFENEYRAKLHEEKLIAEQNPSLNSHTLSVADINKKSKIKNKAKRQSELEEFNRFKEEYKIQNI